MVQTFLHRNFIIPITFLAQKTKRGVYYQELLKTEKLPRNELEALALKRLRHLLRYAKGNVPYYSALFKKRNFDCDIKKITDINALPYLTKDIIQKNWKIILVCRRTVSSIFNEYCMRILIVCQYL